MGSDKGQSLTFPGTYLIPKCTRCSFYGKIDAISSNLTWYLPQFSLLWLFLRNFSRSPQQVQHLIPHQENLSIFNDFLSVVRVKGVSRRIIASFPSCLMVWSIADLRVRIICLAVTIVNTENGKLIGSQGNFEMTLENYLSWLLRRPLHSDAISMLLVLVFQIV